MTSSLLAALVSFCFLLVLFRPLEWAFPAWPKQRFLRPQFWLDLCHFFGQYLLWGGLSLAFLTGLTRLFNWHSPEALRAFVASQPWWIQVLTLIFLSDFCTYWGHRLQHRVPLLWRIHKVHHSSEHMDWLAAHREHPLDGLYTMTWSNLPGILLGFPLSSLATLWSFRGLWAIYIHSNVRLPLGPARVLLGAPELHHWHHHRSRESGNYANLCPWMDLLFGTYRCPDHEPEELGVEGDFPQDYLGQLAYPFLKEPGR